MKIWNGSKEEGDKFCSLHLNASHDQISLLGQKVYIFFFSLFHSIGQQCLPNLLDNCLEGEEATGRKIHNHEEANHRKFVSICERYLSGLGRQWRTRNFTPAHPNFTSPLSETLKIKH